VPSPLAVTAAAETFRVLLLLATFVATALCVRTALAGFRQRDSARAWFPIAFVMLLAIPARTTLARFDEPLRFWPAVVYVGALLCCLLALRGLYTLNPQWTRRRLEAERRDAGVARQERRTREDVLRNDDRVSQAGERQDSRDMFDAGHLDETADTHDRRVETRERQDLNRKHSHGLQDMERRVTRRAEDDAD
jgi:hypothetical protein